MTEEIRIGLFETNRNEERRWNLEKICSCGHKSEAEFLSFNDIPKIHECGECGNKNFLPKNKAPDGERRALPVVFDVTSSGRGFDLKKTNLSIRYYKEDDKIEVIQPNLIRRYVFDWVDEFISVYRNDKLEYHYKRGAVNSLDSEETLRKVSTHLNRDLGKKNKEIINKLNLEGKEFYNYLNSYLGDSDRYNYNKHRFLPMLREALQFKEDYNWAQILSNAGFTVPTMLHNFINRSETKPHKILGISKVVSSIIKEHINGNAYEIRELQRSTQRNDSQYKLFTQMLDALEDKSNWAVLSYNIRDFDFLINQCNYDPKTLINFLFNDIHLYQGISSARDGLSYLKDYVGMCKKMNVPFEKYPKSLKREHDITSVNYDIFVKDRVSVDFTEKMMENDYLVDDKLDKNLTIVLPDSSKDLVVEGSKLNHCVGSYVKRVEEGETVIAFLRNKKDITKPLVTIEVRDWRINQARGSSNRAVTEAESKYIKKWAESRQLQYQGAVKQ